MTTLRWVRAAALAGVVGFAPPVAALFVLHVEGPVAIVLGSIALVLACSAMGRARERPPLELSPLAPAAVAARPWRAAARVAAIVLRMLVLAAGALAICVGINVTPASAFLTWFHLAAEGAAGGTLSYLFLVIVGWFSALCGGLVFGDEPWLPIAACVVIDLVIVAVIAGWIVPAIVAVAIAAIAAAYRAARGVGRLDLRALLSAAEVALAAAAFAAILTPIGPRNALLDAPFRLDLQAPVARLFPRFPFLYAIPGYGYTFESAKAGSRPILTARPVFQVSARPGETLYLTTATYDQYTGGGWAQSEQATASGEALAKLIDAQVGRARHRSITIPGPAAPRAAVPPARIALLIDFYASIPATIDSSTMRVDAPFGTLLAAPEPSEQAPGLLTLAGSRTGYLLAAPLVRGTVITELRGGRDAQPPLPDDRTAGALPPRVRALAASLAVPGDERATLENIRAYLAATCRYTLDPPPFTPGADVVDDFLFRSRLGYCVQFATAFVVLARLDGIAARYATGFLVNLPPDKGSVTVTGLSAHSWAEVWDPERGWIVEEATPPMLASSLAEPDYYRLFNPEDDRYTLRQLEGIMGARVAVPSAPGVPAVRVGRILLVLLAGVAALALVAGFARLVARALEPAERTVRRTIGRIVAASRERSLPSPARAGWRAWGAAAARVAPLGHASISKRAALLIQEVAFRGRPPRRRDARFLRAVERRLRELRR